MLVAILVGWNAFLQTGPGRAVLSFCGSTLALLILIGIVVRLFGKSRV